MARASLSALTEAIYNGVAELEEVVAFLDDHPDVKVYYTNYGKAPVVQRALRAVRNAARIARQAASGQPALDALDALDDACRAIPKNVRVGTDDLRKAVRSIRDAATVVKQNLGSAAHVAFPVDRLPQEIREEFSEDADEFVRCASCGAWRACLMVASRLLELVVARRHWESTGVDPVEKGWTLGQTIAEAEKAGVLKHQPKLGELLRMLNAYRIDSVHVTKQVYRPDSKDAEGVASLVAGVINRLYP